MEPLDVVTQSIHAPSIFVPVASFVWDSSPYFVFKDLEQVPPFGSLPYLSHFPFPRPLPTIWLSELLRPPGFHYQSTYHTSALMHVLLVSLVGGGIEDKGRVLVVCVSSVPNMKS